MIKVPKRVKREAEEGLELRKLGFNGGTGAGIKRAKQLSTENEISIKDLKNMRDWFARHYFTSGPNYKEYQSSKKAKYNKNDLRGAIAILLWGGKSAYDWVYNKTNTGILEKEFNKEMSIKPGEL